MEPLHFSEFSYGYALTDELIHWYGTPLTAAPVFPSLQEEGMSGGGYDVQLKGPGVPLFLQFKLSDRMEGANALEAKAGFLHAPFYRMHLRPAGRSKQHKLLLKLENNYSEVYYCAPGFFQTIELNDAYGNHHVYDRSFFMRPSEIGPLPDKWRHHIAFQSAHSVICYFLSDPVKAKQIKVIDRPSFERTLERKIRTQGSLALSDASLRRLASAMKEIITEEFREELGRERSTVQGLDLDKVLTPLQQVTYFGRTFFDCSLFIVRHKVKG